MTSASTEIFIANESQLQTLRRLHDQLRDDLIIVDPHSSSNYEFNGCSTRMSEEAILQKRLRCIAEEISSAQQKKFAMLPIDARLNDFGIPLLELRSCFNSSAIYFKIV